MSTKSKEPNPWWCLVYEVMPCSAYGPGGSVIPRSAPSSARVSCARSVCSCLTAALGLRPADPRRPHQPGDPLRAVPASGPAQLGVDARRAVMALPILIHRLDRLAQLGVVDRSPKRLPAAGGAAEGSGKVQQLERPVDVALLTLLRLDEPIHPSPGLLREQSP